MKRRMTADILGRVLRRLEAGDSVPSAAEAEGVTAEQVHYRLSKLGMEVPRPRPQTAAELDRLLNPLDPPLSQLMLDYLQAFDAYLCDRESTVKFVRWRRSARELLGERLDEPPMSESVMRRVVRSARRRSP